jgi:hypothetical protein
MTIDPTARPLASTRRSFVIGALAYTRADLERSCASEAQLEITAIGLLHLSDDITPELARATIASLRVYGVFRASDAVKKALADRTR